MRKLSIVVLLCAGAALFGLSSRNAPAYFQEPDEQTLYELPFARQTGYSLTEGPDQSVLIAYKGNTPSSGGIIRFDPSGNTFGNPVQFNKETGQQPCLALVSDSKQNLVYGVTSAKGTFGAGAFFSLDLKTNELTVLLPFPASADSLKPVHGLVKINDESLLGIASNGQEVRAYVFNRQTLQLKWCTGIDPRKQIIKTLPAVLPDGTVVFVGSSVGGEDDPTDVLFIQYNPAKNKVVQSVKGPATFNPAFSPLCAGNGCVYAGNSFGTFNALEKDYCIVKFDPATKKVTTMVLPPQDLTVWGPPLAVDRNGNLIGAMLYGGFDNAGFVIKYDVNKDTMSTVKEWKNGEPGGMTCDAPLLHHSNGLYFGFSFMGGADEEGRFFSLHPDTQEAKELASFR